MSAVVSFKVKREVKERMERFKDRVNWGEELRRFVEDRLREVEAEENLERVVSRLERVPGGVPKGFSVRSVREDRDSG